MSKQIALDLGDKIFDPVPIDKFEVLDRDQLIEYIRLQHDVVQQVVADNNRLRSLN